MDRKCIKMKNAFVERVGRAEVVFLRFTNVDLWRVIAIAIVFAQARHQLSYSCDGPRTKSTVDICYPSLVVWKSRYAYVQPYHPGRWQPRTEVSVLLGLIKIEFPILSEAGFLQSPISLALQMW